MIEEALHNSDYVPVAIFDNSPSVKSPFENVPIFHGMEGFNEWRKTNQKEIYFVVAIGGGRGSDRRRVHQVLTSEKLLPFNVLHPTAYVSYNAVLGSGAQVLAHATVGARTELGECVIVNTAAHIDHECSIADGVHIGPGASLAGCVNIGENTFIGTNATVLPRVKIGKNVVVGAGAVITKDIPDNSTVVGNPAKELIKRNK